MICPNCHKPYLFINEAHPDTANCLRCSYSEPFKQPTYDDYHNKLYSRPYRRDEKSDPQMREILRALDIKKSDSVLDLGCGVGDYTTAVSKYSSNVIGMDISVTAAQKKYPHINFKSHDLNYALPFPDQIFDALISINLIEHLSNASLFTQECARVLKTNGKIAITTANLNFAFHNQFYDKTHVHEWTLEQFVAMMETKFKKTMAEKSSSMFNYFPANLALVKILKPDLLFIGFKNQ